MTAPRTYAISRGSRIGARIGVAVLGALAAAATTAGFLADFGADASFARPMFVIFGAFLAAVAYAAARSARSAATRYSVRNDGIEVIPDEGMPQFVGWNQVTELRLAKLGGVFVLLGPGEQVLLKISTQIEGLGEVLNTILAQGILPKRRMALPYEVEKRYPGAAKFVLLLLLVLVTIPVFAIYQDSGSLAGLLLPAILGLFALVEHFVTPQAIVIDRTGITIRKGTGDKFMAWEVLEGGALAILRGPKGSINIGAAVRRRDGKWEVLRLPGADPIELLAAIAASGPGRIIAAPDRLSLAGTAFGGEYRVQKQFSFTIGRPKE